MATIDEVHDICIEIKQEVAIINQRCVDRGKTIDGHGQTLYGENGTEGVVAKQNSVMQTLRDMAKSGAIAEQWRQRIVAPVITALIISTILGGLILWKLH